MEHIPEKARDDASATALRPWADVDDLSKRVEALISVREAGIRYAESRLNSIAFFSGGLIAGGIAFASMAISVEQPVFRFGLVGISVGMFGVATALLWLYLRSTNPDYPFVDKRGSTKTPEIADARWKWFYWDALPDPGEFAKFGFWGRHRRDSRDKEVIATNAQFAKFVDVVVEGMGDSKNNLAEDIRQLYTLHINERYKNKYLTNLRTILQWGFFAILLAGVAGVIIGWRVDETRSSRESSFVAGEVYGSFDWQLPEDSGGMASLSLLITVSNCSDDDVRFASLGAVDEAGIPLPVIAGDFLVDVPSREQAVRTIEVSVPQSYVEAIDSWILE